MENKDQKCYNQFFRCHKITIIFQKDLAESNFERHQKFNQQSDLSNGRPREGISSDTMYECLQGKYTILWKFLQVKFDNCGYRILPK